MCCDCNDIDINTGDNGDTGYSPQLAVSEACSGKSVLQLISWVNGTGQKPLFGSDIMTDAWLLANPIYLGENGFTNDCAEAVDITGATGTNGTNGSTGSTGATGEQGTPGCDPVITITSSFVGSEEYPAVVTTGGTTCAPSYDIVFPAEIITNNSNLTSAIDAAVSAALIVTEHTDSSIGISTGNSSDIKYTLLGTISGTPSLEIDNTFANWINYYQVGNEMNINFKISVKSVGGAGLYRIEMLIPNGQSALNKNFTNSIGYSSTMTITGASSALSPIITTDSNIGLTHLQFGITLDNFAEIESIAILNNAVLTLIGQITFLLD